MQDEQIIGLYFSRDESAIAETRSAYGKLIRSVAFGILHSTEDAEECESETYLKAWNSIPPSNPQKLAAYLCCIARRLALDRYDYNNAAKRGAAIALDELEGCIRSAYGAEDRLSESELTVRLNSFLRSLDYNSRVIFLRRYWFGDSIADIAKRLHTSQGTVKSRISRTLKRLKEFLAEEGYNL